MPFMITSNMNKKTGYSDSPFVTVSLGPIMINVTYSGIILNSLRDVEIQFMNYVHYLLQTVVLSTSSLETDQSEKTNRESFYFTKIKTSFIDRT
jgi:hypothetical protein